VSFKKTRYFFVLFRFATLMLMNNLANGCFIMT